MKRCDICSSEADCHYCMWYEGPRAYADDTTLLSDLFIPSPSKVTSRQANGNFAEGFLEGLNNDTRNGM